MFLYVDLLLVTFENLDLDPKLGTDPLDPFSNTNVPVLPHPHKSAYANRSSKKKNNIT